MPSRQYFVYMMTNRHRSALDTGVTSGLINRVYQHKTKALAGFTSRYGVGTLLYFEETGDVRAAIAREKEIKGWTRAKKVALIESMNPEWRDLSEGWFEPASHFGQIDPSLTASQARVRPGTPPDSFAEGSDTGNVRGRRSE